MWNCITTAMPHRDFVGSGECVILCGSCFASGLGAGVAVVAGLVRRFDLVIYSISVGIIIIIVIIFLVRLPAHTCRASYLPIPVGRTDKPSPSSGRFVYRRRTPNRNHLLARPVPPPPQLHAPRTANGSSSVDRSLSLSLLFLFVQQY